MQIPIIRNYYDKKDFLYTSNTLELEPGLSVLIGCNGCGKTTLLHQIEEYCRYNKIPIYKYDNLHQGGSNGIERLMFYNDIEAATQMIVSSEGECINQNLTKCVMNIGQFVRYEAMPKKKGVILFDAMDSGFSIDHIIEFKQDFIKTIIEDCEAKGIELYLIISANEFEMARNEKCINTVTLKYVQCKSYNQYRRIVIGTRKRKNQRYKWEKWTYDTT